jgi:hypothetical protein
MKTRLAVAVLAGLSLAAASCGGGGGDSADVTVATTPATTAGATTPTTARPTTTTVPASTSVTIHPLFTRGQEGGVGEEVVSLEEVVDETIRLDFSEDEPGGLGDQSRAASWNAVTVATLLTGSPLAGRFGFRISGPIDGPSAGALKTVALLSLLMGDEIADDITMTGTINPDGTVGPVGGIPEKIQGAAAEGFARVLIPVGQRNSTSIATGDLVDVVALGDREGVEVTEVDDVYAAYEAFTGESLPKLPAAGDARLDAKVYDRLQAQTNAALAKFQQSAGAFNSLQPEVQGVVGEIAQQGQQQAERAANLQRQGLQAGAFSAATQAAVFANASVKVGEALQVYFNQGEDAFFARVDASLALRGTVDALMAQLKTYEPRTVSDASVLMQTYASAFDAMGVAGFAENELASIRQRFENGELSSEGVVGAAFLPLVYYEIAGGIVEFARSTFEVGRELGGPELHPDVDLANVADFFRKASDTNFAAFQANVVKSYGEQVGVSEGEMMGRFAGVDTDVALALQERAILEGLKEYIGPGEPNAEYAQLGFAVNNFARNALLLEKYYSNGQLDDALELVGVRYERALSSGLELGRDQLTSAIGQLRDKEIEPAMEVAALEYAGVQREGGVVDKFDALSSYWSAFVSSRILAYLGGFESEGLGAS